VEKFKRKGAVSEERDGGWIIMETVNDKVEDGFERQRKICLQLKLADDGYAYTGLFAV